MTLRSPIKHCRNCGAAVVYRVPDDGDTHQRAVCPECDTIHYENPLNVVGTVPYFGDKVLRTAIPRSVRVSEAPSYGQSVITYDPPSPGALCYREAAREMALRGAPA